MLTVPNTVGLFEKDILEIAAMVHKAASVIYGRRRNLNALIGLGQTGRFWVDIMHLTQAELCVPRIVAAGPARPGGAGGACGAFPA